MLKQLTVQVLTNYISQQVHSNLGKGKIAPPFYSPGGSSNLQLRVMAGDSTPKSSRPWGQGTPSNTMCRGTPQVYLPNGIQIRRMV